jgi:chromate transporter
MSEVSLRDIFLCFLHLGATAYGGPAMIAYVRQQCVAERQWLSGQDFNEGLALCQVIPGATVMQMSTYVGSRLRGLPGAATAAVGFVLPAFLLMTGLSAIYFTLGELLIVRAVFRGLAAIVVAIILNSCVSLSRTTLHGWRGITLAALAFGALAFRLNLVIVLAGAALLALILFREDPTTPPAAQGRCP